MPKTNSATRKLPTSTRQKAKIIAPNVNTFSMPPHVAKLLGAQLEQWIGADASQNQLEPMGNRVLIRRLESDTEITLTDAAKSIKGVILSVGPGKWHPGEWWWVETEVMIPGIQTTKKIPWYCKRLEWIPGWRETPEVKPGDLVLFNSKWNDLAHAENKGTGADGAGPLERPLSYKLDPMTHLVTEDDIFCIMSEDVQASLGHSTLEQEFLINRKVPGPWSE